MIFDIFTLSGNDSFFTVLSGQHKKLYWQILCELYDTATRHIDRRISRIIAKEIIRETTYQYNLDNPDNTSASDANYIINVFADNGWMTSRYDGKEGEDFLYLTPYATSFIKQGYDFSMRSTSIRGREYLKAIKSIAIDMVDGADESEVYQYPFRNGIRAIMWNVSALLDEVKVVDERIRNDFNAILSVDNLQTLYDKLYNFTRDINGGYIDKMYRYTTITPSDSKIITNLIHKANEPELRERIIQDMTQDYAARGFQKTHEELSQELDDMLYEIDDGLFVRYIDDKRRLDDRKLETLQKAKLKLDIMASSNASYHAILNKIIDHITKAEQHGIADKAHDILMSAITVTRNQIIDPGSLYERKYTEKEVVMEPVVQMAVDIIDDIPTLDTSTSTVKDANECACRVLSGQDEITIHDLPNQPSTITDLMMLTFFADNPDAKYGVDLTGHKVEKCGYLVDEFIIRRKKYA